MCMKKSGLLLSACFGILLSACGGNNDVPENAATSKILAASGVNPVAANTIALSAELNNPGELRARPALNLPVSNPHAIRADANAALAAHVHASRAASAMAPEPALRAAATVLETIPAPIAGCQAIDLGLIYTDATPAAGDLKCYQFVVNDKTKIDSNVLMPNGVTAYAYLFAVDPVSGQLSDVALDTDAAVNAPLVLQGIAESARLVLVVQPQNGAAGQAYQFGAWSRPGFDAYEPNDKPGKPVLAKVNQTLKANIDVAGVDQDYYFFPLLRGQTSTNITINFTAQQSAGVRIARKNPDGSYAWAAESTLTAAQSGQALALTNIPVGSAAVGQYGVMVRVSGESAAAPAAQPYTVRINTSDVYVAEIRQFNNENITRWFPFPQAGLQVHSYIDLYVQIKDEGGQPVEGQSVIFYVVRNAGDNTTLQLHTMLTDQFGQASYNAPLAECTGDRYTATNYGPFNNTDPRWDGEGQVGAYWFQLPGAQPTPPETSITKPITFNRVCKETVVPGTGRQP